VAPLFDDSALFENDDRIGAPHRREPVRDDEGRPVPHQRDQRVLDEAFGLGVER